MSDKPILFSGPMVRALLAGRKTMTRRIVKLPKWGVPGSMELFNEEVLCVSRETGCLAAIPFPYKVGDRLYVKEALFRHNNCAVYDANYPVVCEPVYDPDEDNAIALRWKWQRDYLPSMFMPKHANRISLEVTSVKCERLQDTTKLDIVYEGWPYDERQAFQVADATCGLGDDCIDDAAIVWFANLWDGINGPGAWDANQYVFAYGLRRLDQ